MHWNDRMSAKYKRDHLEIEALERELLRLGEYLLAQQLPEPPADTVSSIKHHLMLNEGQLRGEKR